MPSALRRVLFFIVPLIAFQPFAKSQGWRHIANVDRVESRKDGVELTAGKAKVDVTFFRPGIVRVRVASNGIFAKDASWAIIESPEPPSIAVQDGAGQIRVSSGDTVVVIQKKPLLINFADALGNTVLADEPSLPMAWDGARISVWKKLRLQEHFYGLGDRPGDLNRRNRAFTLWNTDAYGWQESTDPIYKCIPFFIGLHKDAAYGIFFDNPYRSNFNFGLQSQDFYSFGADGGEINYYYFAGPEPKRIVQAFADMTGHAKIPPIWSLGFQQSRYSYYPEARVLEVAKIFRDKKIPVDAIYLDIDYQQGYAPFTVNREYFPHFENMVADLSRQGIHTVLITDLHIKRDPDHGYFPYDDGMRKDMFVKNPDGSVYVGKVWPGDSVFPDFTLTRAREWWGTLYKDFAAMGVAGFWNDMNEPSIFFTPTQTMPLETRHRMDDGSYQEHRAIHNVYGMENVRGTYEGLLKLRPNERPFVLTRAAYPGTQRFAATWSGDNSSTWNHLRISIPLMLNLGISAYPLVGSDIGGFIGSPPPDLLTRWIEVGAFNPIYRDHTGKGTADQEPWVHGPEQEAIRKRYIELRYRLLPYVYTSMEETTRTGIPLMRPIFLEYPSAEALAADGRDFLFGPDLFVAPVLTEMLDPVQIQLPPGAWYDFWTYSRHTDAEKITLHPKLDELPVYVRAGAILPMQPVVQSTSEVPVGPLELRVFPGDDCHGSLYQDDGHTFNYEKGEFLRVQYTCTSSAGSLSVSDHIEKNGFKPWWTSTQLHIFGIAASPKEIRLRDESLKDWHYDEPTHSVTVSVPNSLSDWTVKLAMQ
jgi:alpha-glucosidase